MTRVFIAIDLPQDIRERIAETQTVLARSGAKLTFVAPQHMHITLKFIGEVDDERLDDIQTALRGVSAAPYEIAVRGVGANNLRRPRVIWSMIEDAGRTGELNGAIEDVLAPLGIEREKRAYTAHITIARVRQFDPSLLGAMGQVAATDFGSFRADRCVLKKSTLTKQGPIYDDLMEVVW
ncbi:MAG: RNA 2',3'-cyclic phosphodiesterase [Methanomicrobiaceae archaeon]|nr:RNA 2',3'-cyclic phosphodiesterase [Methanomicrobiaceae archaeon]